MFKGIKKVQIGSIMHFIKQKRSVLIAKKIELRPSIGDDVLQDHNNIE